MLPRKEGSGRQIEEQVAHIGNSRGAADSYRQPPSPTSATTKPKPPPSTGKAATENVGSQPAHLSHHLPEDASVAK